MGPETGVLDLESSAVTVLSAIKVKRIELVTPLWRHGGKMVSMLN